MYEEYWGLSEKPFENSTDSQFYYPSESHQAAVLKLRYVVENLREGAILTGAPGLGKSLIIQTLFRALPETISPRVNLVFPQMPSAQLLAYLADELTATRNLGTSPDLNQSVRQIQSFLEDNAEQGSHALVVIDEAHIIADTRTLDTLRLLLNFQASGKCAMTLLFVGQPSLLPLLERHRDLEERFSVKCLLSAMDTEETVAYIQHRLTQAGAKRPIFSDDAFELIHQLTRGNPRQINRVCDLALLVGFAEEQGEISSEGIEAVADELVAVTPE